MKKRVKKTTKVFEILFLIALVIDIFLVATKNESKLEHADYKVLVQESAGSSNYVTYEGSTFPKRMENSDRWASCPRTTSWCRKLSG